MRVTLLTPGKSPAALKRLQALGHRVQAQTKVQALDASSTELVYLVPYEESLKPDWADTRVRLARASRYYLVLGEGLSTKQIMDAARDGAHDVIDENDADERWNGAIESCANTQKLWWQLYGAQAPINTQGLVGRSAAMVALRESVQRIGPTNASVLVMGESGTGKERVSEAIHRASGKKPFVAMNCAAIPAELLESELFGAEKGAYTGAAKAKPGMVEEAAGGTLFLDEIGELEIQLQPKLLRFLETRQARRVGSTKEYACNVRVISATNRDLREESDKGNFRLDLYYRLSEVILNTPPLRHRVEDIPDLAMLFLGDAAVRMGKNFETLEPELIAKFQQYDWAGNVRELKQVIERMAIHYDGPVMRASWWDPPARRQLRADGSRAPFPLAERTTPRPFPGSSQRPFSSSNTPPHRIIHHPADRHAPPPTQSPAPFSAPGAPMMPNKRQRMELARKLLDESDGDLTWTAAQLGIHPTTLYRWRKAGKV